MNAKELILLNFSEVRRRSIKVWKSIPEDALHWKPDQEAMSCLEMVRHVLQGENEYHQIILHRGDGETFVSPLANRPYTNVEDELAAAQPYREKFLRTVHAFTLKELEEVDIIRKEKKQQRKLGDYLLRIAYHEAVHTGQLLAYLRSLELERPVIWD
jgi:uncharacterized damage-inducible protein DinB